MNTKTIEEMGAAVLAECERVCEKGTHIYKIGSGVYVHRYTKRKAALMLSHDDGADSIAVVNLDGPCQNIELFYAALGLEARDAVQAEREKFDVDFQMLKNQILQSDDSIKLRDDLLQASESRSAKLVTLLETMTENASADTLDDAGFREWVIEAAQYRLAAHKEGGVQG